jgi:predicted PurR-regulated permease PerM
VTKPVGIPPAVNDELREPELVERISPRTMMVVLAAAAFVLYFVRDVLLPFVIAGVVGYAATPLIEWLARRSRFPRWVAAALVFVALVGAVVGFGAMLTPPFAREMGQIAANLPQIVQNGAHRMLGDKSIRILGRSLNADQISQMATTAINGVMTQGRAATAGLLVVSTFFGAILTTVLLLYVLLTGPQIGEGLFALVPPKQRGPARLIWFELSPILRRYFIGIAIVVAYASVASYIGLGLVLGIHHAGLLAILTGLFEMVPVVGPIASAVIAGLVALQYATTLWNIIGYAIYATILRLSIDQLLGPLVLGRAARVHPIVIIFGFLAGGLLFNIAGMIMAVPAVIALKVILSAVYREPELMPEPAKRRPP